MSRDSGHDMGIEYKPCALDAVDLTVCLVQIMVLSHITQDIVQTAFNAQIQMTYTCLPKGPQLFLGLGLNIGDGPIHIDGLAVRKITVNQVCYFQQTFCTQAKGIAVPKKDMLWIAAQAADSFQFCLNLLHGKFPVFQMPEQGAEFALVVRTANGNRKHIGRTLHGTAADLSFIIHKNPSWIF